MRRVLIVVAVLAGLSLLAWGLLFLIYGSHLNQRVVDAAHDAYYDFDPRTYPYSVNCPVEFDFEARCNPDAIHDQRYVVDGGKRRVPAECAERVVHEFFRSRPQNALSSISSLEDGEKTSRCHGTIDYPAEAGGFTTHVDVSTYVFREHRVLVVRFSGKHFGVPRDYDSFEWLGKESLGFADEASDTLRVRIHADSGERLECLYNPFNMMFGELYSELKGAFVCSDDFDVTRAFVVDPPMRPPGPGKEGHN